MLVTIQLQGTSPLVCHNERLADPDDEIVVQIGKLTAKRSKKTEEDRREIAKLEWFGGLYTSEGIGIAMPTYNIKKCLIEAAKATRQGKDINRAVNVHAQFVPIQHTGPNNLDKLYETSGFKLRRSVGNKGNRVMRTRPCFPEWTVTMNAELLENMLDFRVLQDIATRAGIIEGLGDARTLGFGRFQAAVSQN